MALKRIKELLLSLLSLFFQTDTTSPSPAQEVEVPQGQSMAPNNSPTLWNTTLTFAVPKQENPEWGKTILNFCFTTAIAFLLMSFQTQHQLPWPFPILSLVIILAFSTSLLGIFFRSKLPIVANVLELIGVVSVAIAFFIAMAVTLPPPYESFAWLFCALSFLSIFILNIYASAKFSTEAMTLSA